MSDLYLVLRRRLETVAQRWIEVPTGILKDARTTRGLSYEAMGRELHIASKTWERYEKAGRIPIQLVDQVAHTLELEIDHPTLERHRVEIPERPTADVLERVEAEVAALARTVKEGFAATDARLAELTALLPPLRQQEPPPAQEPPVNG